MGSDRPHLDPEPERLRKAAADLRLMYGADTGASVRLDRAAARIAELEAALSAEKAKVAEAVRERDEADFALVDKYRNPKTGVFSFPADVAAIVRKLDSEVAARAEAAEAEAARLREALKPFAQEATEYNDEYRHDWQTADDNELIGSQFVDLTFGHFRRARAALGGDHG